MFTTKLYKKYFPLSVSSIMTVEDYNKFEKWLDKFLRNIEVDNINRKKNAEKMGLKEVMLYKCIITQEDIETIKKKFYKSSTYVSFFQLDEKECDVLNAVLQAHKKNSFIQVFFHGDIYLYYEG